MARGMVVGEDIVSQANTEEFERGYERTFGADRKPQRGRYVWDEAQGRLVNADEYTPPPSALSAPVMVDRFMEGVCTTEGIDIGSRRKRREYMKTNNLADADDFKGVWKKAQEDRLRRRAGDFDHHERREAIGRALHELRSKKR